MYNAIKTSTAIGLAALVSAAVVPARADKPTAPDKRGTNATESHRRAGSHERSGVHPRAPGERDSEARAAHGEPGKRDAAHAAAPGQDGKRGNEANSVDSAEPQAKADEEARQAARVKRQKWDREELKRRYGLALLARAPVQAELERHAWRVARLERIQTIAEAIPDAAKRKKTLERLAKLLAKEQARHERHMAAALDDQRRAETRTAGNGSETMGARR